MSGLVSIGEGHSLSPEAAASWERMKRAGMPGRVINSSTRDYATQKRWFQNKGKPGYPKYVANPDESKHVWRPNDKRDKGARALDLNDPARSWMVRNGGAHGWYRPWPTVEPWHFEYRIEHDKHQEDDMALDADDKAFIRDLIRAEIVADGDQTITYAGALRRTLAIVRRLETRLTALTAAVEALARSSGLDPATVERIISSAVDEALSDLSITLTTGD